MFNVSNESFLRKRKCRESKIYWFFSVYLGYALNERKNTKKNGYKLIKKHMKMSIK